MKAAFVIDLKCLLSHLDSTSFLTFGVYKTQGSYEKKNIKEDISDTKTDNNAIANVSVNK